MSKTEIVQKELAKTPFYEKKDKPKPMNIEEARVEIDKQIFEKQSGYMKSRALYSHGKIWKSYKEFAYVGSKIGKILDLTKIDNKIKNIAKMLKNYKDQKIILFSKNPNDMSIQQLAEILGCDIKSSYSAGNLTNTNVKDFLDIDLIFMFDFYSDYLIKDAIQLGLPIIALVEPSNEESKGITLFLPCNKYFGPARAFIAKQIATYYLES